MHVAAPWILSSTPVTQLTRSVDFCPRANGRLEIIYVHICFRRSSEIFIKAPEYFISSSGREWGATVLLFVIDLFLRQEAHFKLIHCIERLSQSCLGELQLNQEPMNHCYSSATGAEDYRNYVAHLCQAYNGRNRPAACNTPPKINSSEIADSVPQVCYPRKRVNLTSSQAEEEMAGPSNDSAPHRKKQQTPNLK